MGQRPTHETIEIALERGGTFSIALPRERGPYAAELGAAIARDNRYHQEPHIGVLALDLLRGRGSLIDVGANIGLLALAAAKSGVNVVAVEPLPENALCLTVAALHNDLENLLVLPFAAGTDRRVVSLFGGEAWARIADDGAGAPAAMLSLDDIAELAELQRGRRHRRFVRRPLLIKIDTEGGELSVLQSARRLIERHAPDLIVECPMIEGQDHPISHKTIAVKRLLAAAGYHLYLHRGAVLVPHSLGDVQEAHLCDVFASRKRYREGDRIGRFSVRPLSSAESLGWTAEMVANEERKHRLHAVGVLARWRREGRAASDLADFAKRLRADPDPDVAEAARRAFGAIAGR